MSSYIVQYYIAVEHKDPIDSISEIQLSNGALLQPDMLTLANYVEVTADSPHGAIEQTRDKVVGTESALSEQPGWVVQDGASWSVYEVMNQDTGEVVAA